MRLERACFRSRYSNCFSANLRMVSGGYGRGNEQREVGTFHHSADEIWQAHDQYMRTLITHIPTMESPVDRREDSTYMLSSIHHEMLVKGNPSNSVRDRHPGARDTTHGNIWPCHPLASHSCPCASWCAPRRNQHRVSRWERRL